jgi:hypothetical protein
MRTTGPRSRLECCATGPGLTGSSLASQGFWRRLWCSAKRSAGGHRGHHARIHAVGMLPSRAKSNLSTGEVCGAGGARTHDRRIMSPVRQHPSPRPLTWANVGSRHVVQADFGTYLA